MKLTPERLADIVAVIAGHAAAIVSIWFIGLHFLEALRIGDDLAAAAWAVVLILLLIWAQLQQMTRKL